MRVFVCAVAAGWAFLVLGVDWAGAGQGCALPPRTVRAVLDAGGARYEWASSCGGARVVIHGSYNDRTNRATEVVVFPDRGGATNAFEVRCARNPWAPGERLRCTRLHTVVNVRSAFTEPWFGQGDLRQKPKGPPARTDGGRAWAPTPLLPPNGTVLPSTREALVELRWTSSGGGAAHYRVELQRGISAQGPFSEVQDADVTGNAGLSVAYTVAADVLGAAPHQYWRWRVGQTTSAGGPRFSAWQTFSFR